MPKRPSPHVDFAATVDKLKSSDVVQYAAAVSEPIDNVQERTRQALESPEDFPAMSAAILPGDLVSLAIDPNVPNLQQVLAGIFEVLSTLDLGGVVIALWDEATDETVASIERQVGETVQVVRHQSSSRSELRYLGADQAADPIYLNRQIVDSDFVLPVAVGRPLGEHHAGDMTGIYPAFADSRSRKRQLQRLATDSGAEIKHDQQQSDEPAWLLGVQMMLCVLPASDGAVSEIVAATPDAVCQRLGRVAEHVEELPPSSPLVIASLDGDSQQQTWSNAARAITAASRFVSPGGTIVLWSAIQDAPGEGMLNLTDDDADSLSVEVLPEIEDDGEFPAWNASEAQVLAIRRIASEYRVLIHSELESETIEATGLAAIQSEEELIRLSGGFERCGVLRAAQFAS